MILLEITDKDGGWIRTEEHETVADMLKDWPDAERLGGEYGDPVQYTVWIGSNP